MQEITKRQNRIEWACRILMTADVFVLLWSYFNYYLVKWQLVSPLIPKSTIYQILFDDYDTTMKAVITAGLIFIAGLWFYSFNKKVIALILFSLTIVVFKILTL